MFNADQTRLIEKALKDRRANLETAVDAFKRAYGKHHENYTRPLMDQVNDINLMLIKIEEPTNLYFINGSDNNGDSMDLFVRAGTPEEAFEIWKASEINIGWATCFEGVLATEPTDQAGVEDLRIFLIPEGTVAGPVNWHTPEGVSTVAHVNPI